MEGRRQRHSFIRAHSGDFLQVVKRCLSQVAQGPVLLHHLVAHLEHISSLESRAQQDGHEFTIAQRAGAEPLQSLTRAFVLGLILQA